MITLALIGMILLRLAESTKLVLQKNPAVNRKTLWLVVVEFFRFG